MRGTTDQQIESLVALTPKDFGTLPTRVTAGATPPQPPP